MVPKVTLKFTRRRVILGIASGAIMAVGLIATFALCGKLIRVEQAELRSTTAARARNIALQVQTGVLAAIEPLDRLGRWWITQGKPADAEDWATDGQLFLSHSTGLRAAMWVTPDGWQKWSAAPGATPSTTKVRPDRRIVAEIAALQNGERFRISDVFETPGAGPMFYVNFPVSTGGKIRGHIVGLYDARAVISKTVGDLTAGDQRISLSAMDHEIYAKGPRMRSADEEARAEIRLGDRIWTVGLSVPSHFFQEFRGLILTVIGVIGALIYAFIMLLALSQRWSLALQKSNAALADEVERRLRKESEVRDLNRELSRKVADFETLLDVIPIGISVADHPDCANIRFNKALAAMLGVTAGSTMRTTGAEAESLTYRIQQNGRTLAPDEFPIRRAAISGRTVLGEELRISRADGTAVEALSFASPLLDEKGHVRGALNAWVDVSDRRKLELRLQRAERMKSLGAMAAGIAHDFNNLLTAIIGRASLTAESVPPDSEAGRHIKACIDSGHQASALIQKVLAFTGNSFHTVRPTNLGETIQTLRPDLHTLAGSKSEIRIDVAPNIPVILADTDEIRQVTQNLVVNALEAIGQDEGNIEIRIDVCELTGHEPRLIYLQEEFLGGTYVRLKVSDTGAGMHTEIAERAFDPFFSTKFLGRGLGLSEVLGIMRGYDGAVRLKTSPGTGTSIELFFPSQASKRASDEERSSPTGSDDPIDSVAPSSPRG